MQLEPLFTIYSLIDTDIGVYALSENKDHNNYYYDPYFLAGQSTNLKLTCHMAKVLAIHILNESISKKQYMVPNKQQLRAACLMNKLKFKYFFIFKPYDGTP